TSVRPSRHCAIGVVQAQICWKNASSSAWYVAQKFLSEVRAQALLLAGASPNHSATAAFASGDTMWSIHMYAQFGCLALAAIIHVSAQPVAPSLGRIAFTGAFSPCARLAMTCQVVPSTLSPDLNACTSLR